MKPYTRFLFRRARRVVLSVLIFWGISFLIAYGVGALAGVDARKNSAAKSEVEMYQRIKNKQWAEMFDRAEYMTGMPAKNERK